MRKRDPAPELELRPSKSQRKREALALQDLGELLVELKPTQLAKLPLPDDLRDAVLTAQQTPQRGARKRQLQYIGKLMRRVDPEPIRAALELAGLLKNEAPPGCSKRRITTRSLEKDDIPPLAD